MVSHEFRHHAIIKEIHVMKQQLKKSIDNKKYNDIYTLDRKIEQILVQCRRNMPLSESLINELKQLKLVHRQASNAVDKELVQIKQCLEQEMKKRKPIKAYSNAIRHTTNSKFSV